MKDYDGPAYQHSNKSRTFNKSSEREASKFEPAYSAYEPPHLHTPSTQRVLEESDSPTRYEVPFKKKESAQPIEHDVTNNSVSRQPLEKASFQPKKLPKSYSETSVKEDIRTLTKRLTKTKASYLLFENSKERT